MKGFGKLLLAALLSLILPIAYSMENQAPSYTMKLNFSSVPQLNNELSLTGLKPVYNFDFQIKNNALLQEGTLNLTFTPSPSLISSESHLKISLNDEYVGMAEISDLSLGQTVSTSIALNSFLIKEFNRLKIEFIGQYKAICPSIASPALWLELSNKSHVDLKLQMLESKNDLAYFPEPFFFENTQEALNLPMVFAHTPDLAQVKSGAIISSFFGSFARWRGANFPVSFNEIPKSHAIVFVTNSQRPTFLSDFPQVKAPTIEMRDNPRNPYYKLLVMAGRNSDDLVMAAKGLAQGNLLLRGKRVQLNSMKILAKRKPYDAPNWVDTSKPVSLFRLLEYKEQLITKGISPPPIALPFKLPPDLYLTNGVSIPINLKYRYSLPETQKGSFLNVGLNGQFVKGFQLKDSHSIKDKMVNALDMQGLSGTHQAFYLPSSSLGTNNKLNFSFLYSLSYGEGTKDGKCISASLPNYQAIIDANSTIDFSSLKHFMTMPNLNAFIETGYPFSRLADLSETMMVIPTQLTPTIVTTIMNLTGHIGAQTGYPVLSLAMSNDWQQAIQQDVDILYLGAMPQGMRDPKTQIFALNQFKSWLKQPMQESITPHLLSKKEVKANTESEITAFSPIAAIVGMQSPEYSKRSIVALLANSQADYHLLLNSLKNPKWRSKISGSVAVIRDSGIQSLNVGKQYYVGHMPWWLKTWYELKSYPLSLACAVLLAIFVAATIFRALLKNIGKQRIRHD